MQTSLPFFKMLLIAFVLPITGGCATQAMNRAIASWQNQPISAAIAEWGAPSEELKVSGKHLYLWNNYDDVLLPRSSQRPTHKPDTKYCTRLLEVDGDGKVIFGGWEGSDCPGIFSGWAR
ncbi:MAG: hypothetical protein GJV46_01270 [Geobacter sp.]|nr:hypothetical protein [Geobacter sp.]